MERQLDQPCLTPEEAYVRSKDLLEKGISEDIAMRDKVKYYQSKGLFASMAIGTFLALITQNPASFFIPIILVNVKILPLSMKVIKALRLSLEEQKRDLEKLMAGDLNPVDYYESRRKRLTEMGKARVLDSLSSDTSKLSYDEREMLTKFSGPKACG